MTKAGAIVSLLAGTVMAVLIFEAVKRELSLRHLKQRLADDVLAVKLKEAAIVEAKTQILDLRNTMNPLNAKRDDLYKKKNDMEKEKADLEKGILACNNQKKEAAEKMQKATENLDALKFGFEQEKKTAQEHIQTLKQNILDRDRAICAFVDTANEEGRKLCGIFEATR